MEKTYYKTCPDCKANLDPGERCDCQKKAELLQEGILHLKKAVVFFRSFLDAGYFIELGDGESLALSMFYDELKNAAIKIPKGVE